MCEERTTGRTAPSFVRVASTSTPAPNSSYPRCNNSNIDTTINNSNNNTTVGPAVGMVSTYSEEEHDTTDNTNVVIMNSTEDKNLTSNDSVDAFLCGRSLESRILLDAYNRMRKLGTKETVVVHGASGTGKTALISATLQEHQDSFKHQLLPSQSPSPSDGIAAASLNPHSPTHFFCRGKFVQNQSGRKPYSAIMEAFTELCQLVALSEDFEQRRPVLQSVLGNDGHILSKQLDLALFLDPKYQNVDLAPATGHTTTQPKELHSASSFTLFQLACTKFLQAMACDQHPVVLVLDDVQWIDHGSRQVLKTILEDADLKHILLVVVYTDDEEPNNALIADLVKSAKQGNSSNTSYVDVQVRNLDHAAIHELVLSMLGIPTCQTTQDLTDFVMQRTSGNPLYVKELVEWLEHESWLRYDSERNDWMFELDATMTTVDELLPQTLADIMNSKIQLLSPAARNALKVASLLGFRFHGSILADTLLSLHQMLGQPTLGATCIDLLLEAHDAGFIDPMPNQEYQFGHDTLQSSFRSMIIDHDEILLLHNLIGGVFLARGDVESLYHAAGYMTKAVTLLGIDDRIRLARVSLDASKLYCCDTYAFWNGADLLRDALRMIPKTDRWGSHRSLTLQISITLSRMEMIIGNLDACQRINEDILRQADSLQEKLETLALSVEAAVAEDRRKTNYKVAVDTALATLGFKVPPKLTLAHIAKKLFKVRFLLRGKIDQDIQWLPLMDDQVKLTAIKILVFGGVVDLLNGNEKHSIYCALLAVELSLKFGLSKYTPTAFSIYSMTELVMGNLERAYRFGNLAQMMVDSLRCRETGSAAVIVVNSMVSHWKESLNELVLPTTEAAASCFKSGNVKFGIFGAAVVAGFRLCEGENLAHLESEFRSQHSRFKHFQQEDSINVFEPSFQFVLNLRSTGSRSWDLLSDLSGEVMVESDFVRTAIESNREVLLTLLWIHKIQLAYYFGSYEVGESALNDMESFRKAMRYSFNCSRWLLFGALIWYGRYRETSEKKYLRKARKFKRRFRSKALAQSPNSRSLMTILDAEDASVTTTADAALQLYDIAITAMSEANLVHFEALAYERAGCLLCAKGDTSHVDDANQLFLRAYELYNSGWGGTAKANHVQEISAQQLQLLRSSSPN